MNVYYKFRQDAFKNAIADLGYKNLKDFCRENNINYNTLCNTIYKNNISITMLCRLALILECQIDDLLLYGEE